MERSKHPMEDPNRKINEAEAQSVSPEDWIVYPVMDSADYLDREVPLYRMADGTLRQGAKIIADKADES